MQYYRAIVQDKKLAMHLENRAHVVRYARSCRDVSSRISQDAIAVHAGILSRGVRSATSNEEGAICVWRINPGDFSVEAHQYAATDAIEFVIGDWIIVTDQDLINKLASARAEHLPNETGGILLGSVDSTRKIIYVVDILLSPIDSIEWPTSYIRGFQGLNSSLEQVKAKTLGNLDYIGEWHSHPDGCTCKPSTDDLKALAIISEGMAAEAVPAVMIIVAEGNNIEVLVGQATD
jgi:integrative and conjugative element protein (TIGR02256 family)